MANNTQIVRKSLLKSSISLTTINKSVTFLSKDLKRATNLLQNTGKVQEQDNRFKRGLIGRENTWFNRRREQVLRREKEDITEASSAGGAIKRRGKVVGSSTKGFLGRILDVFGILFIGWLTTNLPPILKAVNNMIKLIQKTVSILSGFINNTVGFFNSLGSGLDDILSNITIAGKFERDSESIKKGFDDMNKGTRMFSSDIDTSIGRYLDPKTYGRDNWDIEEGGDETQVEKPTGTARNLGGLVDFMTFGLTDLDKRGNLFGGRHGRTGFTNVDGAEANAANDELIEQQEEGKNVETKIEPKETLVKETNKQEDLSDDPKIANDPNADLEKRFDNGYIPKKDSPDYAEYKEWLNAPGGLEMFKDGGIIKGKSHSQGGENINVEGGEAVIPKKSVDRYGPEFINAIIEGDADKITKIRAARGLLEELVRYHKEDNEGIIRIDEYDKLQAQTVDKLKEHLNAQSKQPSADQVTPKQQSTPKIEVSKSKVNQIASGNMKRKRKVVNIPIPNNNQQPQQAMAPPSGRNMQSGKPRPISGGLHIGDLQSLMLAYT